MSGNRSNDSDVFQGDDALGDDMTANVTQEGAGNISTIIQNDTGSLGGFNTATIEQIADGATSRITQDGSLLTATVRQYTNAHSSTVTQGGTGNTVNVTQGVAPM